MSVLRFLATVFATLALLSAPALAAPDLGPELPETVRLNASVTVSGPAVRLGDVFNGLTANQDRVIAQAPYPGQRTVLSSTDLANFARTYGIDWRPADAYDRATIFRPGQIVTQADMEAALKADLVLKGLPQNFGLRAATTFPTLTVPMDAIPAVSVREAFYDVATRSFSAVLEFAGPDGTPQFWSTRGAAVAMVSVPVLIQDAGRNAVITQDMIAQIDVPEIQVRQDTITEAALLIGMSPRGFIPARRPVRDNDVIRLTLVDVPVLRSEMRRDGVIHESHVVWTTKNAAELPPDVVVSPEYLIGKSPRSFVAGGAPIRRGDVIAVRQVQMAVAARDLTNGVPLQAGDINWVPVGDNEIGVGVVTEEASIRGRATTRTIRAGQALRAIDLVRPTIISRGKAVTIVYATGGLKLTMKGQAMEDGGLNETIRVTNVQSKSVVVAEVIDSNTVRVTPQQSAMQ